MNKLRENKKLRILVIIGFLIFSINILINLARVLNHAYYHFELTNSFGRIVYHTINHPLFVFFEHSWIEIFSAILVYFLLEDKFKNVDRIPEKEDGRDHEKILRKFSTDSKEEIRILDTSIYSFTENYDLFCRSLESALDKKAKIEILLLHPDTYAAEQRSRDLTVDTRTHLENMRMGLNRLHRFISSLPASKKDGIKVKLFKTTPMMIFAKWDDNANFGLLHPNKLADKEDTFLVKANSPILRSFDKYFDDLWHINNYRNKKTVFLDEYLFVKITCKKNTPISGLNWGGDNESHELPRYITDLENQKSFNELKKYSDTNAIVKIEHDNNSSYGLIKLLDRELDSFKTIYANSQIRKTLGNDKMFNNFIFRIEYLYDTQVMLKDKDFVKEKLDLKGYAFISHNQYDVKLTPLVRNTLTILENCFDNNLSDDKYDEEAILKAQEKFKKFKSNPRRRLMAIYNCKINDGMIQIAPYLNDSKYPFGYSIFPNGKRKEIIYQVQSRTFVTLHKLLESARASNDLSQQQCLESINAFLKSTIRTDIIYLLGANDFILCNKEFKVYVHLIRTWVSSEASITALPTPQSDRNTLCDYQVIHLIRREHIIGGVNEIYVGTDGPDVIKDSLLLENPLDSVFFKNIVRINNKKLNIKHFAGEIQLDPKRKRSKDGHDSNFGFRDVVVIEYIEKRKLFSKTVDKVREIIKKM